MTQAPALTIEAIEHPTDARHGGRVEVTGGRFTIGRGPDSDWVMDDPKRVVSKLHAVVERTGDGYRLTDRSTNGLTVNARPLTRGESHTLRDGDEVVIGAYGFRIRLERPAEAAGDAGGAPPITSILHDLAPAGGLGADGPIAGESRHLGDDPLAGGPGEGGGGRASGRAGGVALPLGWDAPPGEPAPAIPAEDWRATSRDLTDRSEQAGPHRRVMDLPVAAPAPSAEALEPDEAAGAPAAARPVIPLDWLDDDPAFVGPSSASSAEGLAPEPSAPPSIPPRVPLDAGAIEVVPVENLDLEPRDGAPIAVSTPAPQPMPPPVATPLPPSVRGEDADAAGERARERMVAALADGFGVSPGALAHLHGEAEFERLLRNMAAALAITAAHVRESHDERVRLAARLELGVSDGLERTPWINALGATSAADLPAALARALSEQEPHETEGLRGDMRDARRFTGTLVEAVDSTLEAIEDALDPAKLRRRVRFLDRFKRGGRAAVWRALLRDERVYGPKDRPRARALFAEIFARARDGSK